MILDREFYTRDAVTVAKELLGKVLVKKRGKHLFKGRITEERTEQKLCTRKEDIPMYF